MLSFLDFNYENCPDISEEKLSRFKWMAKMRFVAAGSLFVVFTLLKLTKWVNFPYMPVVVITVVEMFINQPYPRIVRLFKSFDLLVFLNLLVDILIITWSIQSSEGMDSYYNLLVYPLVFVFAGIVFSRALTFALANISWFCYAAMVYLEYTGVLPTRDVYHVQMSEQDRIITTVLVLPFYNIIAFFVSYLGTVLREREQQLKETKAMLIQANKLAARKAQVAANAELSQRFSPSLMMMRGHLQKILETIGPDHSRTREIRFLESEVDKMYEAVNAQTSTLAEVSRPPARRSVNVIGCIEEAVSLLLPQLSRHNIEVYQQYDSHQDQVEGDPEQIQKVIFNLLNYFRGKMSGSQMDHIWVMTRNIQTDLSAAHIEIKIKANGFTPTPKELSRIFDAPFTTKGGNVGGLGMSITYGIVQNLQGDIRAVLEKDQGMAFIVTLPVWTEEPGPSKDIG